MKLADFQSRGLVTTPQVCALGRISLSGTIRNSRGLPLHPLRVLGEYAVVHLLVGSGRYQDANGVDVPVTAGDVLILFPDLPHRYGPGANEAWSEIYYIFDGPIFDLWRRTRVIDPSRPVLRALPVDYWLGRWLDVAGQSDDALGSITRLQQALADVLAAQSARRMSDEEGRWLERAKARLARLSPLDRPNWETIAASLGVSYAGFRKRFKRLAGMSPGDFVESCRLALATNRLSDAGAPLKQIARETGFCDEFHFSRRFKLHTGLTPREYRRRVGI